MVTELYNMVKNLLVIIMIASFFELLLPDGRLKPFVRWAVGLFILIAILNPTLNLLFHNNHLELGFWDYQMDDGMEQQVQARGEALNQRVMEHQQQIIQDKLQGQISAVTNLVPGVNDVHTEVQLEPNGNLHKVELTVRSSQPDKLQPEKGINVFSGSRQTMSEAEQQQIEKKIMQVISNLYGLPGQDVEINFEGG